VAATLNNVATQDRYAAATTLLCPQTQRLTVHVRNANAYYQLGHGYPVPIWDVDEVFFPAGSDSMARSCDAIRVRSALAGAPAQVTIDAQDGAL
jgi:hypothetical protein